MWTISPFSLISSHSSYIRQIETEKSLPEDISTTPQIKINKTILIVDEEKYLRSLIKECLIGSGADLLLAADGREALEIFELKKGSIDLFVLDIMMPHMNGLALYQELTQRVSNPHVLFLSGFSGSEKLQKLLQTEKRNIKFLQKPFETTELIEKVISLCS